MIPKSEEIVNDITPGSRSCKQGKKCYTKKGKGGNAVIRILIVEDDTNIAKTILASLSVVGYVGEICTDGREAIEKIQQNPYDLILLDVMLPGADGFSVMEQIRDREIPVIFLTAMQNVTDKVRGLKLGAEDYIVKPFEVLELLARVEVVLRRANKMKAVLTYGDITLDIQKHIVTKGGKAVSLTPKEFETLQFFMEHPDVAVARDRLLAAVWGYGFEGESRTVDIHIRQLRKKLDLFDRLVTVPKIGYRLESR